MTSTNNNNNSNNNNDVHHLSKEELERRRLVIEDVEKQVNPEFAKSKEMSEEEIKERKIENWSRNAQSIYDKYLRPFIFNFHGKQLFIKQQNVTQEDDLGFTVWDGALVLSAYFESLPSQFWYKTDKNNVKKAKKILEVGAGTGLCGIAVSQLNSDIDVTITDLQKQLEIMKENISHNLPKNPSNLRAEVLGWGQDVSSFSPPFDTIIAAECIYFPQLAPLLCKSLKELSNNDTEIFVAYERHNEEGVEAFWNEASKQFEMIKIPFSEQATAYRSERITLLKMKLKQ